MNVAQVIAALEKMPPDATVETHDGGYMQDMGPVEIVDFDYATGTVFITT